MVWLEGGDDVGGFTVNVTRVIRDEWARGLRDPSDRCVLTKRRARVSKRQQNVGMNRQRHCLNKTAFSIFFYGMMI